MRKYTSPPQIYTGRPGAGFVNSLYTFPHDLGEQPFITKIFMECVVPDLGYAKGAIVPIGPHAADNLNPNIYTSYATGFTLKATPTDVILSFDTNHGASIHQYDAKKNGRMANGSWKILVKVYAP